MGDARDAQRELGNRKYAAGHQLQAARAQGQAVMDSLADAQTPPDLVSFADGMPALLVSEESLEALNLKLQQSPLCKPPA